MKKKINNFFRFSLNLFEKNSNVVQLIFGVCVYVFFSKLILLVFFYLISLRKAIYFVISYSARSFSFGFSIPNFVRWLRGQFMENERKLDRRKQNSWKQSKWMNTEMSTIEQRTTECKRKREKKKRQNSISQKNIFLIYINCSTSYRYTGYT